jgi:hypothetical protein
MYREVYEAIDAAVVSLTCLPASEAVVRRALFKLDMLGDHEPALAELTRMSIELQTLAASTWSGDSAGRRAATEQLRLAARQWMERLPIQ